MELEDRMEKLSFQEHHSQEHLPLAGKFHGSAALMRKDLDDILDTISDRYEKEKFTTVLDGFFREWQRYQEGKQKREPLDWERVRSPDREDVHMYSDTPTCTSDEVPHLLNKLAVVKLNGGLGTTMGCVGPKSAIEVRDGLTFLDLTVQQVEHLNARYEVDVPLVLMNSFNTDEDTKKIIRKYQSSRVNLFTFEQSRWPRIKTDTGMPITDNISDTKGKWYPPGHGDFYQAFYDSGLLDRMIDDGKEWLFVSNVDNLGATVDPRILKHMEQTNAEFLMEVTNKTKADIKGGTIIQYDNQIRLLEIAQVPKEHVDDFKRVKKFKIFNTNNLWIRLSAIRRLVVNSELNLDLIVNNKTTDDGTAVVQLETAVGAAIKHFNGAFGINVPRSRFLPVKSTSDLFLVTSDLYTLVNGTLTMNPLRTFPTVPNVKLGDDFKRVDDFLKRFKTPPKILELDHLTVSGDVVFGAGVTLAGTVIIVANYGAHIDIPRGATLNDKIVSGDLRILDH